jgi:hypothetical protein
MVVLYIIIVVVFILVFRLVHLAEIKYKWFISLKQGDKVMVRIYADNCECMREATVTNAAIGKYIDATIDNISECSECARLNSVNDKLNITCWYHATSFHRKDVNKPKVR